MDGDNVLYHASRDAGEVWNDEHLIRKYDEAYAKVLRQLGVPKDKKTSKSSAEKNKKKYRWSVGAPCEAKFSEDGIRYEAVIVGTSIKKGTCRVKYVGYDNEEDVDLNTLRPSKGVKARDKQYLDACNDLKREWSENDEGSSAEDNKERQHSDVCENHIKQKNDISQDREKQQGKNDFTPHSQYNEPRSNSREPKEANTGFPFTDALPQMHRSTIPAFVPPPLTCMTGDSSEASAELSARLMAWYTRGYQAGHRQALQDTKQKYKN